jgi:bifunctional UDP-N-acetylglucosamine pyrophosphorylase/glucosamine-1-phosphate N-acetyltransferase
MHIHVVILAAGKGTRMKSARAKVLHRVAGQPMIEHVLAAAAALEPRSTTVVVGHQADSVKAALAGFSELKFEAQDPQHGPAHPLLTPDTALRGESGTLVLLSGDVPLLSMKTLQSLVERHATARAAATVLTAVVDEPAGYGRIVRGSTESGEQIARIAEEKDATSAERQIREINCGIYALSLEGLFDAVRSIAAENVQKEYYLPDLVQIYRQRGLGVETVTVSNPDEIRGINSRIELAAVSRIVRNQKNAELMAAGVTLEDPATAYIDREVTIGADTIVHPGVSLEGRTTIGASCEIHTGVRIVNSQIGDRVQVFNHCVIADARIADEVNIGPFAHLRNQADVRAHARVGNFVELKKTVLGEGSKAMHLAYLGDAIIGEHVNVGAGTITCNYDGVNKNTTVIEDGAFVGSDSQLIAPVTVGKGAYVGSGTTIRENVPAGALAISAGKQRNIEGWVEDKKKKRRG